MKTKEQSEKGWKRQKPSPARGSDNTWSEKELVRQAGPKYAY